jgi:GGDEF domain-containing protein
VLLPRSDEAGARRCAQRILVDLANPEKFANGQHAPAIAGSIGIALFPAHAAEPENLLQCAEHALHQAKYAEGDRVALFEPSGGRTAIQSAARLRNAEDAAAKSRAQGEE